MRKSLVILVLLAIVVTQGCASSGDHTKSGAKKGAVWGAILGGVAGLVTGDVKTAAKYAAIGAAAGAVTGAAIGAVKDRKVAERTAAVEQYAYNSYQGHFIKIESMALSDPAPAQGDEVVAVIRFTAISPSEKETIKVGVTPKLVSGEDIIELKAYTSKVVNGGGTMEVTLPINLNIPEGSYSLETDLAVVGESATDSASVNFYIG